MSAMFNRSHLPPATGGSRPKRTQPPLLPAIALAAAVLLPGVPVSADVIGEAQVIDGDTLQVAGERVRLHGIDAPETKQACSLSGGGYPCGQNATRTLSSATAGKVITCKGEKRDRYGRLVAVCYAGDDDLNARMVRDGWALAYRRYGKDYVPQETQARAAGSGLWQGQFVEPWEWRKQSREAGSETGR
jgi:endonuclease YncB( thermonuclease family)